jgi:Rrf2 family protein
VENILKISEAASLGMHAAVLLAVNDDRKVSTKEIAKALGASEHHLAKVLQRLAKAGLARSFPGPKGGFLLARPAESISLLDVFEAIEGKFTSGSCLLPSPVCTGERCILGVLLETVGREVKEHLAGTSLGDLREVCVPGEKGGG